MTWQIKFTLTASEMLRSMEKVDRTAILKGVKRLEQEPEKRGKPLRGLLAGYRSLRVSRYRIVYQIVDESTIVIILAVGIRREGDQKDIYSIVKNLIRSNLLED